MLAPRKVLWSTPDPVIMTAFQWLAENGNLTDQDMICDIGCGDGRVILSWAEECTRRLRQFESRNQLINEGAKSKDESTSPGTLTPNIITPQDGARSHAPRFIGIDIDAERIKQAQNSLNEKRRTKSHGEYFDIDSRISVEFYCINALEAEEIFQTCTVFFLYLIPRGLRIMKPILDKITEQKRELTVITYMSPLPDSKYKRRELIPVPHQPGAAWPLFQYHLSR